MAEEYEWVKGITEYAGEPNTRVFVHVKRSRADGDWLNTLRHFLRVPVVGEYVALNDGSALFRVESVVHCPFDTNVGAEIWCSPADYLSMVKGLNLDAEGKP